MASGGGGNEGDLAVADVVRNRMGATGAREQVKEWLYDALETSGWTTALERAIITGEREKQQRDRERDTPVGELVQAVARKAFDSVPQSVRDRLCRELVAQVRELHNAPEDDTDVHMGDDDAALAPSPHTPRSAPR